VTNSTEVYARLATVSKLVISHPEFERAFSLLCEAYVLNTEVKLNRNYLVVGQTGTGKSTIKDMLEKKYPSYKKNNRTMIPVLTVNTPAKPTVKNMADEILLILGDPIFYRGSAVEKTSRILMLLKACEVKMVIFDEVQHFIDQGHRKLPYEVADWLKTLIDNAQVSAVLMGLERSEYILHANEQLRRRFCRRITLRPFDLKSTSNRANFIGVLNKLESSLNLAKSIDFQREKLIKPIYFATNGIMDYIVKLILGAYQVIQDRGKDVLDRKSFEEAFSEYVWVEGVGSLNPFHKDFIGEKLIKPGMPFHKASFKKLDGSVSWDL